MSHICSFNNTVSNNFQQKVWMGCAKSVRKVGIATRAFDKYMASTIIEKETYLPSIEKGLNWRELFWTF